MYLRSYYKKAYICQFTWREVGLRDKTLHGIVCPVFSTLKEEYMDTKERVAELIKERCEFAEGQVGGLRKKLIGCIFFFILIALTPVFVEFAGYVIPVSERLWWFVATALFLAMPVVLTIVYIRACDKAWREFPKEKREHLEWLEQKLKEEK